MTDRATLLALEKRCEQAVGPDRKLDARIYIWITGGSAADADYAATDPDVTCNPPRYTASLDAAVTLVPDGHEWLRKNEICMTVYREPDDLKEWARHIDARAATPALALCAAALRARAEMGEKN